MSACLVEVLSDGGYRVTRTFNSKAAAMSGMEKLLSVVEVAFIPTEQSRPAPSLPETTQALVDRVESQESE